jgi:hypothetical protein
MVKPLKNEGVFSQETEMNMYILGDLHLAIPKILKILFSFCAK